MNRLFVLAVAEVSLAISPRAETHELKLTPMNVHWGYYDAHLKPVLKIASGDTVRVETMVAGGLERLNMAGVPDAEIPDSLKQVRSRSQTEVPEHILSRAPFMSSEPSRGILWRSTYLDSNTCIPLV